jgi:isopentenyl-diphosphate delta-isomerase
MNSTQENVILVDENDAFIGVMEKLEAHQKGKLHRAFSVFVFNNKKELLLQKRALTKYHSGGLWTNTSCSHQRLGETTLEAAHRRLQEEMGFDCDLSISFSFVYKTDFMNGLCEHEFDHVLIGHYDGAIAFNPEEVSDYKYMTLNDIQHDLDLYPEQYTYWFKIAFDTIVTQLKSHS